MLNTHLLDLTISSSYKFYLGIFDWVHISCSGIICGVHLYCLICNSLLKFKTKVFVLLKSFLPVHTVCIIFVWGMLLPGAKKNAWLRNDTILSLIPKTNISLQTVPAMLFKNTISFALSGEGRWWWSDAEEHQKPEGDHNDVVNNRW